ncbi:hypothetical protein ABG067_007100 [Albugo candida]
MADTRMKNVIVSKPIAYGSIASYLGRKSEETKTHRWTIYLRGIENEDLSYMISKVEIHLHSSFANPVRVFTEPPYEVTELGWGEFETKIRLHFHDSLEKPVEILHMLVLYPPSTQPISTKKPVISEYYDELVFHEPTDFSYRKLMAGPDRAAPDYPFQDQFPTYSDVAIQSQLTGAHELIAQQIQETKDLMQSYELGIRDIKEKIAERGKKRKSA